MTGNNLSHIYSSYATRFAMAIALVILSVVVVVINPQLGVLLLGGLVMLIVSWALLFGFGLWPKYGLVYVIACLLSILIGNVYLINLGPVHLWLSLSDLFLLPSLVIVIYEYQRSSLKTWSSVIAILLLAFVGLVFFRGLLSEEPTRALSAVKAIVGGILFFLVTSRVNLTERRIARAIFPTLYVWACGLLIMVAYHVVITAQSYSIPLTSVVLNKVNYLTPLGRTNYIASLALILWPLVFFGAFMVSKGLQRVFAVIALCAIVATLMLLYSRGALVTFGLTFPVVITLYLFEMGRSRRLMSSSVIGIFLVTSVIVVGLLVLSWQWLEPVGEAAWSLITSPATWRTYRTAQGRFRLWQNAVEAFVQRPLWGHGLYNVTGVNIYTGAMLLTHNLPLQLLAETGIVGFFLYGSSLFIAASRLVKRSFPTQSSWVLRALSLGMLCSLIVGLANSLIEANFLTRDFDLMFWGMLGLALNERVIGLAGDAEKL